MSPRHVRINDGDALGDAGGEDDADTEVIFLERIH